MNPPAEARRWRALALPGTAFFMVMLDGTIVYVAASGVLPAHRAESAG